MEWQYYKPSPWEQDDFRYFFENQLKDNQVSFDELSSRLGRDCNRKIGRLIRNTDPWTLEEVLVIAQSFGIEEEDVWEEFIRPLRERGLLTQITINEMDQYFAQFGDKLDRVAVPA